MKPLEPIKGAEPRLYRKELAEIQAARTLTPSEPRLPQTVREHPKAVTTAAARESARRSSEGNALADGNNVTDAPMGNPQRSACHWRTSRDCKGRDGRVTAPVSYSVRPLREQSPPRGRRARKCAAGELGGGVTQSLRWTLYANEEINVRRQSPFRR